MDGSRIVTPLRMWASLSRTRRLHSAAASCERSLMPSNRPSSSNATALTIRPSSRASRTSSVRYSSPVAADGVRRPDPAPQPGGVEGVEPGVDLVAGELVGRRVLRLDDALDRPELAADHPAELGRVGREDAGQRDRRVVLRGAPRGPRRGRRRSRAGRRRTGRGPRSRRPARRPAPARDRVAGPARLVLEGEGRRGRRRRRSRPRPAASRRRSAVPAGRAVGRAGPGVEHVGQHRPAAQRVEDLGRRRTASGCRGRPPARRRPCRSTDRDLGGSRGAAPSGAGRGAVLARDPLGARRE